MEDSPLFTITLTAWVLSFAVCSCMSEHTFLEFLLCWTWMTIQCNLNVLNLVKATVVEGNQIPMLRHTLQMGVDFEEGGNRSARRKPSKSGWDRLKLNPYTTFVVEVEGVIDVHYASLASLSRKKNSATKFNVQYFIACSSFISV